MVKLLLPNTNKILYLVFDSVNVQNCILIQIQILSFSNYLKCI